MPFSARGINVPPRATAQSSEWRKRSAGRSAREGKDGWRVGIRERTWRTFLSCLRGRNGQSESRWGEYGREKSKRRRTPPLPPHNHIAPPQTSAVALPVPPRSCTPRLGSHEAVPQAESPPLLLISLEFQDPSSRHQRRWGTHQSSRGWQQLAINSLRRTLPVAASPATNTSLPSIAPLLL